MVPVDCIPPHRQGLNSGTYGCCKIPVVKTKVSDVRTWIQTMVFSDFEKQMHARVISETDAHKGLLGHQCAQPKRPF